MSSPMTFFSGTPPYEGDAQPTSSCSTGLFGWLSELMGFPCTPAYEADVYLPPKGGHSCGDVPPEGYPSDPVYVVAQP